MCCRSSLSFDIEARGENSLGIETAAVHQSKENGVVAQETNVALACDLNTSMEQASNNNTPLPEEAQHQSKSSPHEAQQKEKPTRKRKYVRKKALSNNSAPPIEVTGKLTKEMMPEYAKMCYGSSLSFDIGARDENSLGRENAAVHLNKEIGAVAIEKPTHTRKYVRHKALNNNSAPPAKVTGKLTTEMMPEYAKMCCGSSFCFDIGAGDENSLGRKNAAVHISKGIGVLAIEKPTCTRKYVTKKALSNNSVPATEVTGKLTKEMVPEYAKMCYGSSMSFDRGARENAAVHLSKEIGVTAIKKPTRTRKYVRRKALNKNSAPPAEVTGKLTKAMKPTRTRKYVRRKALKKNSAPPAEVTGKLTKEMMPECTKMCCRSSFIFDIGARGNTCKPCV